MNTSLNDPTEPLPVPQPISAATARRRHGAGALVDRASRQFARFVFLSIARTAKGRWDAK
jgi:hypothetical protein